MTATPIHPAALALLSDLAEHNDRAWFAAHAEDHRRLLVEPFAAVLAAASERLADADWPVRGGRSTMARPMRDQRYARDAPYRTCVRGLLTRTGATPTVEGCVHVELTPRGGFVGVGFHRPPRPILDPIRQRVLAEPDRWCRIRDDLAACGRELSDDRLARMPSGFTEHGHHPLAADLRLRSITVVEVLTVEDWTSGSVVDRIVSAASDGGAMLRFGNTAVASRSVNAPP